MLIKYLTTLNMNSKSINQRISLRSIAKMLIGIMAVSSISLTGCKSDDDDDQSTPGNNDQVVEISGDITSNVTWKAAEKYLLKGFVYVKDGATVTIEPGTVIKGDKATKGTLIIERGAKIMAEGTVQNPIVFTSNEAKGNRSYGDWGGIIICGKAPVNLPGGEGTIEGGVSTMYGGTIPTDNSGKLKYVRIEFPGIAFQPNSEINGLTLGAVGSDTEISHIQVSYCGDDSYEMFGGTVDLKNVIAFRGWDDDFDTDLGYQGRVQYAVALRDPAIADASGSNGFESDNDGAGTTATPITRPVFSNVSIFGPLENSGTSINNQFKRAAHLRRNTQTSTYNSVFAGYPTGLLLDGNASESNAAAGTLVFRHNIISGCTTPLSTASGSSFDLQAWFDTPGWGNSIISDNSNLKCGYPFTLTSPNFLPQSGSPLLSGADFTHSDLQGGFFDNVSYRGAFGATDWTLGWANFDPQNSDY